MSDVPDIPKEDTLVSDDRLLAGLTDELKQFAESAREHLLEGRIQEGYKALSDVLACAHQLMRGLPFFGDLRAEEMPSQITSISTDGLVKAHREGRIKDAFDEMDNLLDAVVNLTTAFGFASTR